MKKPVSRSTPITITMSPLEALSRIHGVLNKLPYPNVYPIAETAETIAFALGFKCDPLKG